ncbi:MAG: hypothetical protein KDB80_13205 [Planctomycetes bacterium]|nr:hypothetical protein [Planctomycetota bacterium]
MSTFLSTVRGSIVLATLVTTVTAQENKPAPEAVLASTRWFVDATPVIEDDTDDDALAEPVELTFCFDAKSKLAIDGDRPGFIAQPATLEATDEPGVFSVKCVTKQFGTLDATFQLEGNKLSGSTEWTHADGTVLQYELAARKACELDGTKWKVTVTPDPDIIDDDPTSEVIEFHRGHLRFEPESANLLYDAVAYTIKKTDKAIEISAMSAKDAGEHITWKLTIRGNALTGEMVEHDGDTVVARYGFQGKKLEPQRP